MFRAFEDGDADIQTIDLSKSQVIDWWCNYLVGIQTIWQNDTGKGIKVGIIDTGGTQHLDVVEGIDKIVGAIDTAGHGTHMAGIVGARNNNFGVVGVAPDCRLYLYQAIPGDSGMITAAINQAVADGVDIISMSLGGDDDDPSLHAACIAAYNAGIILVAAAGNDPNTECYPAKYPEVIAVSAIDQNFQTASFAPQISNHFAMPGVDILSTWLDNQYAKLCGTSPATPVMAGLIALILGFHRPARSQVALCVHDALSEIEQQNTGSYWYKPNMSLLEAAGRVNTEGG